MASGDSCLRKSIMESFLIVSDTILALSVVMLLTGSCAWTVKNKNIIAVTAKKRENKNMVNNFVDKLNKVLILLIKKRIILRHKKPEIIDKTN